MMPGAFTSTRARLSLLIGPLPSIGLPSASTTRPSRPLPTGTSTIATTPSPPRSTTPGTARHRAALQRGRRRQPAQLPPHPLPRPAGKRRAHPAPGRPDHRRVRRHHPLLDKHRLPHRPPRPGQPLAIPFPPGVEAACRERADGSAHQHRNTSPAPRREQELTIAEVAARLGVKPDVIYAWTEWGHIPPGEATPDGCRSTHPPSSAHASNGSPGHTSSLPTSKPKPNNAWKGQQYEAHVPVITDRVHQARVKDATGTGVGGKV